MFLRHTDIIDCHFLFVVKYISELVSFFKLSPLLSHEMLNLVAKPVEELFISFEDHFLQKIHFEKCRLQIATKPVRLMMMF